MSETEFSEQSVEQYANLDIETRRKTERIYAWNRFQKLTRQFPHVRKSDIVEKITKEWDSFSQDEKFKFYQKTLDPFFPRYNEEHTDSEDQQKVLAKKKVTENIKDQKKPSRVVFFCQKTQHPVPPKKKRKARKSKRSRQQQSSQQQPKRRKTKTIQKQNQFTNKLRKSNYSLPKTKKSDRNVSQKKLRTLNLTKSYIEKREQPLVRPFVSVEQNNMKENEKEVNFDDIKQQQFQKRIQREEQQKQHLFQNLYKTYYQKVGNARLALQLTKRIMNMKHKKIRKAKRREFPLKKYYFLKKTIQGCQPQTIKKLWKGLSAIEKNNLLIAAKNSQSLKSLQQKAQKVKQFFARKSLKRMKLKTKMILLRKARQIVSQKNLQNYFKDRLCDFHRTQRSQRCQEFCYDCQKKKKDIEIKSQQNEQSDSFSIQIECQEQRNRSQYQNQLNDGEEDQSQEKAKNNAIIQCDSKNEIYRQEL